MKKKSTAALLILFILTGILIFINRDLFHYEQIFVYRRTFNPETDNKGDYILSTESLPLKPGNYHILIEGSFEGTGSGMFLIDSKEEKIISSDLPSEGILFQLETELSGSARQLRFGISYDPSASKLFVDRFIIRSNHLLYRSSLFKHAVISGCAILLGIMMLLRFVFPKTYQRLFPHLSQPQNERMLLLLLFLTLVTASPYFRSDSYVNGDDFYYHMRHIRGVAASIKAGHFPARILLDWIENYGYGSGFYYPNLFLILPGLLLLLGFETLEAYEIFISICNFLALWTMFLTIRRISRSEKTACAGTIIYAFAAYRLIDIYYRAAIGEIQAFIFLPLIIMGLYEIFNGNTEKWWIFGLAFTGLLCCHVITLALAAFFTAVWAIFHVKHILSDKKIFMAMLKAVFLCMGLGAWFILPMIEQSATNQLKINMIMFSADTQPFGSSSDPRSLFLFFYDWNYIEPVRKVYPGWQFFIIPFLRILFIRKKGSHLLRLADELTIFGFVCMIMCTSLFPWTVFIQFLYRIQFAWRIMIISTVLLSVSCGIYATSIAEKLLQDRSVLMQLLPVFLLSAICGTPILIECLTNHVFPLDNYRYMERSNFLSGSEYMPMNLDRETIEKTGDHIICEVPGFKMNSFLRKGLSVTWDYSLPEGNNYSIMQVPLIYYTGYHAYLTQPDGTSHEIPVSKNDLGLITVTNEDSTDGMIKVRYEKTLAQHIGDSISFLILAGFLFYVGNQKKQSVS